MKIELHKDGAKKIVDSDNLEVLEALAEAGWEGAPELELEDNVIELEVEVYDERDELVAKCAELGIKHHHALGVEKLAKLIEDHEG